MEKIVITLVIESEKEEIHSIKGKIIETASESLTACDVTTYDKFKRHWKRCMNIINHHEENIDPYEIRQL